MPGRAIGWLGLPDGVVVVDTQMAPTAKACLEGLSARFGNRPIECVFKTHYHRDHTGGDGIVSFEQASVVHVEDLVFNRRLPVLDRRVTADRPVDLQARKAGADYPADTKYIFYHAKPGFPVVGHEG